MSDRLIQLASNLEKVLGKRVQSIEIALGEVTVRAKDATTITRGESTNDGTESTIEAGGLVFLCHCLSIIGGRAVPCVSK